MTDFDDDYDDDEDHDYDDHDDYRLQKAIVIWARLWVWVNYCIMYIKYYIMSCESGSTNGRQLKVVMMIIVNIYHIHDDHWKSLQGDDDGEYLTW